MLRSDFLGIVSRDMCTQLRHEHGGLNYNGESNSYDVHLGLSQASPNLNSVQSYNQPACVIGWTDPSHETELILRSLKMS